MNTQAFASPTTLHSQTAEPRQGLLRELFASTPLAVFFEAVRAARG